jgi:riboflavin kinase / FMN adenylyltransferase
MSALLAPPYWRGLADVPWNWGRSVVTLGVFDGLHRGHARLLAHAVELGERRDLPVVLVTFNPHPATVAGPRRDTSPLVCLDRRVELAREHGADAVLVLPFTGDIARTSAVDFVLEVLVRTLRATDVVVGADFRFGHRGTGDVQLLHHLGAQHGFHAHGVPLLEGCSSSEVRRLLADGDVLAAARVLGRTHQVRGTAVDGRVVIEPGSTMPAAGRYRVLIGDAAHLAIVDGSEVRVTATDRAVVVHFLDTG